MVSSIIHTAAPWLTLQHNRKLRLNCLITSPGKKKIFLWALPSILLDLILFSSYSSFLFFTLLPLFLHYLLLHYFIELSFLKPYLFFYWSLKSFLSVFLFFSVFLSLHTVQFHSFVSLFYHFSFFPSIPLYLNHLNLSSFHHFLFHWLSLLSFNSI